MNRQNRIIVSLILIAIWMLVIFLMSSEIAGTSINTIRGKLKNYSAYFQQDAWGVTETPFPKILYIAEDGMTEQGIRYHIKKESFRADTDIEYFTTTQKALLGIQDGQGKIWTSIGEEGQLASLEDL